MYNKGRTGDTDMCQATENAYKTAITRTKLSTPMRYLLNAGLLTGDLRLDYGCGKGSDVDFLTDDDPDTYMDKYDPHFFPNLERREYDLITCNFVLNVLPESMWQNVIDDLYSLLAPGGVAYISVRNDKSNLNGFTKRGTYQTFVELNLPVEKRASTFVMYRLERKMV